MNVQAIRSALAEAERRQSLSDALIVGSNDAIIAKTLSGIVTSWNPAAERIFGYTAPEMIGQPIARLIPPDRLGEEAMILAKVSNGERVENYQTIRRRKNGELFPIAVTVSPIRDSQGAITGASKIARDITDAVAAAAALEAAEAKVRQFNQMLEVQVAQRTAELSAAREALADSLGLKSVILASTALLIVATDEAGTVTLFNRAAEQALGYQAHEIVGRRTPAIWHDAAEIAARAAVLSDELDMPVEPGFEVFVIKPRLAGIDTNEWTLIRQDNTRFPVRLSVTCLRNGQGGITGYLGVIEDISERKKVEEERNKLITLVEESTDYIGVGDMTHTLEYHNRSAKRMIGLPDDSEMKAIKLDDVHPPWALAQLMETALPAVLATGAWSGETALLHRDGREIPVLQNLALHRDAKGEPKFFTTVMRDITERKKLENDLLVLVQKLKETNQDLDEFAYAASHDLKAPLRVIDNASQWLMDDLEPYLNGETRENMALLRGRVRRMEKLLNDLLEYSRIGRKTDKRALEIIGGDELLENVLVLLSPPAGFSVTAAPGFAAITVARMPLQQVLLNLISNAIKHHDKTAGVIELSVEEAGGMLKFSVRDDGPGIPRQYHEQIFKMFQTLKPRDQVEGSGMGLAMVRKHIEVAGGALTLESEPGQGSLFRFTWPKPPAKPAQPA